MPAPAPAPATVVADSGIRVVEPPAAPAPTAAAPVPVSVVAVATPAAPVVAAPTAAPVVRAAGSGTAQGVGGLADSLLPNGAPEPASLSLQLARPDVEIAPLRVAQPLSIDFRPVDFAVAAETEWALARFSLGERGDAATMEELQRTLRSGGFSTTWTSCATNLRRGTQAG